MKKVVILGVMVVGAAALAPSYAADRTISSDYTLSADETVDGILTVAGGATIDLSGITAPLDVVAPFNTAKSTAKGVRTLHFEPGATLGVKLGERRVAEDTPIISWTAADKPDATVKFISADIGSKVNFMVRDDGLYVVPVGFMVIFR